MEKLYERKKQRQGNETKKEKQKKEKRCDEETTNG
jgi:hypothetical protein